MCKRWGKMNKLFEAIQNDEDIEIIERAVQNASVLQIDQRLNDTTILTCAVRHSNVAAVELLLHKGANVNATSQLFDQVQQIWRWETPLVTAARQGISPIVSLLVSSGATLDASDNTSGRTPLLWACKNGHSESAQILISHGANLTKRDYLGDVPIIETIINKNMELTQFIIFNGAPLDAPLNADGDNALLFALFIRAFAIAHFLLAAGSDVCLSNRSGEDPLTVIFMAPVPIVERRNMCCTLLQAGARVFPKHIAHTVQINDQELYSMLKMDRKTPKSLRGQCRLSIRRNMLQKQKKNREIFSRIAMLPLPTYLKDFLKFDV